MPLDLNQPLQPVNPGGHPIKIPPVVIRPERKWFHDKLRALGGAPGKQVGDIETVGNGFRLRYDNGAALYADAQGNVTFVYGAIGARYDALGGPSSWLGFPTSDEQDMSEGGRANTFEHGTIYFWPDTGAIECAGVIVHYTGLICFGETDFNGFRGGDYPYGVLGVLDATTHHALRTQIYQDVNGGNHIPDLLEIYRGQPVGLRLSVQLVQHGQAGDSADRIKAEMGKGLAQAAQWVDKEIGSIPVIGPPLAVVFEPCLEALAPIVANGLADLLGLADVSLGDDEITLTAKQMVVLAARTANSVSGPIGYKVQTKLMSRRGASYKLCFGMVPMAGS